MTKGSHVHLNPLMFYLCRHSSTLINWFANITIWCSHNNYDAYKTNVMFTIQVWCALHTKQSERHGVGPHMMYICLSKKRSMRDNKTMSLYSLIKVPVHKDGKRTTTHDRKAIESSGETSSLLAHPQLVPTNVKWEGWFSPVAPHQLISTDNLNSWSQ